MTSKQLIIVLLLPALAIAYYFAIALPANDRAKLQFEKFKYDAEKKEKTDRETQLAKDKFDGEVMLNACMADADTNYWNYIHLNGTEIPGKPGTYRAQMTTWDYADKVKKESISECHKKYDK